MKKTFIGLWVLIGKLAGKFIPLFAKLVKGLKVGKMGLAGASLAAYAYMFTWQFAVLIMLMLFIHESGHVWAMRRCGVPTKGFYFIPFLGGAAVADEAFPSRWAESYIAIMGPIWGLATAAVWAGIYYLTSDPIWAAAASWGAMINLVNLLPINPLDGGRIFKSITFSINSWLGLMFMIVGLLASIFISWKTGLGLFWFIFIFGGLELVLEWLRVNNKNYRKKLEVTKTSLQTIIWCHKGADDSYRKIIKIYEEARDNGKVSELAAADKIKHYEELIKRNEKEVTEDELELKKIEIQLNMPSMTGWQIFRSVYLYAIVAGILFLLMLYMNHIPGADAAMEVLRG